MKKCLFIFIILLILYPKISFAKFNFKEEDCEKIAKIFNDYKDYNKYGEKSKEEPLIEIVKWKLDEDSILGNDCKIFVKNILDYNNLKIKGDLYLTDSEGITKSSYFYSDYINLKETTIIKIHPFNYNDLDGSFVRGRIL
jgi:hypothetical protein